MEVLTKEKLERTASEKEAIEAHEQRITKYDEAIKKANKDYNSANSATKPSKTE